jgi:muconate cycloisomerase
MRSRIWRVTATPVAVPARPDSLNSVEVVDADTAFARKFHTGNQWADFPMEPKWILEAEDSGGRIGIGETYRGVSAPAVEGAMRAILDADVLALNWRHLDVRDSRVYDAAESAVLDLAGQLLGVPVFQLLGGACRDRVECSGWTGRRTPRDAARKAAEAMERGHRVFKFKCSSEDPVRDWIAAISERCNGGIRVLLDPNQRWHDAETTLRMMRGVDASMLAGLEDPVSRGDLDAFRRVRQELGIPMFLHVALPYDQDPADVLRAGGNAGTVDGFNFNGSMYRFVELAAAAATAGLPCWHGSEVDLGILEVSALHACAASPSCTLPSDVFGELVREDDLLAAPIRFEGGCALVPQGPGLGVSLDRVAMERYRCGASISCEA